MTDNIIDKWRIRSMSTAALFDLRRAVNIVQLSLPSIKCTDINFPICFRWQQIEAEPCLMPGKYIVAVFREIKSRLLRPEKCILSHIEIEGRLLLQSGKVHRNT
ncbi:hypothetical protein CEXT_638091 [Caerostris extrusa]|uniref:Uncharacterized protein n=1 Tax=Caerostris extrusa TaxID=172846 RepID=A0AAV4WNG5_CAEEX|nr:hypothetical protein CEXT_638091 [Caerostris extrusa]